jgi:hypothetical protein
VTSDDKPFKGMHHDRQSNVTRRDAMKGGVGAASLAAIAPVVLHTVAATTPTFAQDGQEPLGGQPPKGATPSIKDFDYQIKYHRAFEAVLWNMPAIAIYSFRRAAFSDLGMKDNDIIAYSATATPKLEAITANSSTPYIAAYADLQKGPVVLELPAAGPDGSLLWSGRRCMAVYDRRCRSGRYRSRQRRQASFHATRLQGRDPRRLYAGRIAKLSHRFCVSLRCCAGQDPSGCPCLRSTAADVLPQRGKQSSKTEVR